MARFSAEEWEENPDEFRRAMADMPADEFMDFLDGLPEVALKALLEDTASLDASIPLTPMAQAMELDPKYQSRPHLDFLSDRIALAVEDVKSGKDRKLLISMPPRSGKSELISKNLPVWLLRQVPTWKVALISYAPNLATQWSRDIRRLIEQHGMLLGLKVASDAGAVENWETTAGGEVRARSVNQALTGQGANVMIIDDPIKDSIAAHYPAIRQMVWERWTNDLQSRLEPPSLVIVVQTRWHEDDLSGRLTNPEQDGSVPEDWEVISFPAIATENDVLGREPGDPLYPPLLPLVRERALAWWEGLKRGMSSYNWSAMYQQKPSPSAGTIFNTDWWCYWTRDPSRVTYKLDERGNPTTTPDGRVILLPDLAGAALLDSWDLNFDDTASSDFVVAQRWAKVGQKRFLLDQRRGRWDFPATLAQFRDFNSDKKVFKHLVEKKANGAAMIKTLRDEFTGIKPVNPTTSKENRARAVTGEIESGHVFLPHPNELKWVGELMSELREFPTGVHDDQVDVLTQALDEMREGNDLGSISVPSGSFRSGPQRTNVSGAPRAGGSPLTSSRVVRRVGR